MRLDAQSKVVGVREHHDRPCLATGLVPQSSKDIHAIHVRHRNVEQYQVKVRLASVDQSRNATWCDTDVIAGSPQRDGVHLGDQLVIVDQEDAGQKPLVSVQRFEIGQ